jgi:hypothetical protein
MNEGIYEELKQVARAQTVAYYGQIAPLADLDMDRADHRAELGRILGEISRHEHSLGRPMLSAVVVHAPGGEDSLQPGKGFFELARELGVQPPDDDDDTFYQNELRRVHAAWRQ